MKPVSRWPSARTPRQTRIIFRGGYKPKRVIRIRPSTKLMFTFRRGGFGEKPKLETYEYATD